MDESKEFKTASLSTIAFVDFECWVYGLKDQHDDVPDIGAFFNAVKKRGRLSSLYFFGDFDEPELKQHLHQIRIYSNQIINCSNPFKKKNVTDFIMLDHIYRTYIDYGDKLGQIVLVTGDGHFASCVSYFKNLKDLQVGVYAVPLTLSDQLQQTASWYDYLTGSKMAAIQQTILQEIHRTQQQDGVFPTFSGTVKHVANKYSYPEDKVRNVLSNMINKSNLFEQKKVLVDEEREVQTLTPLWDRIAQFDLWTPNTIMS